MAAATEDACRLVDVLSPTAVVLDRDLPNNDARHMSERIAAEHPGLTVVVSAAERFGNTDPQIGGAVLVARNRGLEGLAERILAAGCGARF